MGNFSRKDTFDAFKHYVGVRLQPVVPIVDADWNELEDIRKYELRAFLKWFVGDGVPRGNDGFRIQAIEEPNDFEIRGGDGTAEGAGHCLVDGWDVINESDLTYSGQALYLDDDRAAKWDVPPVEPLNTPTGGDRTDTVYLDVWEREVSWPEDPDLINPDIGLETCVRLKREWAVRVREGTSAPAPGDADYLTGHNYYALAIIRRRQDDSQITADDITDLRRTDWSLAGLFQDLQQTNRLIGRRMHMSPLLRQTVFSARRIWPSIGVGRYPRGVAFDGTHIWVANGLDDNVSRIDATSNAVVETIPVGDDPFGVAFDGTHIWVTNTDSDTVSKIDAFGDAPVETIELGSGSGPMGIAFDGTHIWVANSAGNTVSKIDAFGDAPVETIQVGSGSGPMGVAFDGTHIWVTRHRSHDVIKIIAANNEMVATVSVGSYPRGIAFDGAHIWVANILGDTVSKIDTIHNTLVGTISVGDGPIGVGFDGAHVWVANTGSDTVSTIDATSNAIVATVQLDEGDDPFGVAFDGAHIWVTNRGRGTVSKITI